MNETSPDLKAQILEKVHRASGQRVWTPRDFLDLGERYAVDKALQRMAINGELRRIARGLYDNPTFNALTQKDNPPNPRQVIEAVARREQIRVLVDGLTAANDLGLTNAVPAKIIVHTDTRLKSIVFGKLEIIFKLTAASKLYWAGRPAMRIVQALHWLRDTMGQQEDDQLLINRLDHILNQTKEGRTIKADLKKDLTALPTWMQKMLRPLIMSKDSTS